MRAFSCGAFGVLLVLGGALRAGDDAARAIVDKALKAMGGAEKVAKFATGTAKCKISHDDNNQQITIAGQGAWHGQDKSRLDGDITVGGESHKLVFVINGEAGWLKKDNDVGDAPPGLATALKHVFYTMQMPYFLAAMKEKSIASQGEQSVDGKDAVVVSVAQKDFPDVSLYFDKETGLPVKSQTRITTPDNREVTVEFFFADFQDVKGVKHAMKRTLKADGKEFVIEVSEIEAKDKVEDSDFARP